MEKPKNAKTATEQVIENMEGLQPGHVENTAVSSPLNKTNAAASFLLGYTPYVLPEELKNVPAPTTVPPAVEPEEDFYDEDETEDGEVDDRFHCVEVPALTQADLDEYVASGQPMAQKPFRAEEFVPLHLREDSSIHTKLTDEEWEQVQDYQKRSYQEWLADFEAEKQAWKDMGFQVYGEKPADTQEGIVTRVKNLLFGTKK